MKTSAPTLTPLLRSSAQGLLLADLFLDPSQEHSLSQMAGSAGTGVPTVKREVDRLVESGYALDRRVGATRLVRANANHPMFGPLRELVLYAYGPVATLTPLLRKIKGVEKAFIYGSWAARVQGEPGLDPGDIDVLLVSNLTSFDAYEIGKTASEIMKREVNVQNISAESWQAADSGFVKTLKTMPLVELKLAQ